MQILLVVVQHGDAQPLRHPAMTLTILVMLDDASLQAFENERRAVIQDLDDLPEILKVTHPGADQMP